MAYAAIYRKMRVQKKQNRLFEYCCKTIVIYPRNLVYAMLLRDKGQPSIFYHHDNSRLCNCWRKAYPIKKLPLFLGLPKAPSAYIYLLYLKPSKYRIELKPLYGIYYGKSVW